MFYSAPVLDGPDTAASTADIAHVRNVTDVLEQDCDRVSATQTRHIWVAKRSYFVDGYAWFAVVFSDKNNDEYQVAIAETDEEANAEYEAAVLTLANQNVKFATSDVSQMRLDFAAKANTTPKRTSFLSL